MELGARIRRLERVITIQGLVIFAAALWVGVSWAGAQLLNLRSEITVHRSGNSVRISPMNDGPFLVTHLTVNGRDAASEAEKLTAALLEPTACIDSGGITVEDITKLKWLNTHGEISKPPSESTRITALMVRAEYVEPREAH